MAPSRESTMIVPSRSTLASIRLLSYAARASERRSVDSSSHGITVDRAPRRGGVIQARGAVGVSEGRDRPAPASPRRACVPPGSRGGRRWRPVGDATAPQVTLLGRDTILRDQTAL